MSRGDWIACTLLMAGIMLALGLLAWDQLIEILGGNDPEEAEDA